MTKAVTLPSWRSSWRRSTVRSGPLVSTTMMSPNAAGGSPHDKLRNTAASAGQTANRSTMAAVTHQVMERIRQPPLRRRNPTIHRPTAGEEGPRLIRAICAVLVDLGGVREIYAIPSIPQPENVLLIHVPKRGRVWLRTPTRPWG